MTLIHCPTCNTYLTEPDKHNRVDCLKCGDNFSITDAHVAYANYTQLVEKIAEHHPEQLKRIIQELGIDVSREKKSDKQIKQERKKDVVNAVMARAEAENEIAADSVSGREEFVERMKKLGYDI